MADNPYLYCRGTLAANPDRLQQELNFPTLYTRQWDSPAEQGRGKFLMNLSYGVPLLKPANMMYAGFDAADIGRAAVGPASYELQGARAPFPHADNRVTCGPGSTWFGLPTTHIQTPVPIVDSATVELNLGRCADLLTAAGCSVTERGTYPQRGDHAACTCRMARSPSDGVVDPTMRVHETDNLYIASNAMLPTIGAANVTLTLVVAAIMKAMDALIGQIRFPWS